MAKKPRQTTPAALLVEARRRAGLTQEEVAARAGTSPSSVSQYETGKRDPSVTMLIRLIQICGVELYLRADLPGEADRSQEMWDVAVGPVSARRNAKRARAGLIQLRNPAAPAPSK